VGQDEASNDEIDAMLRKLEKDLDQLRRAYEKFFVGSRERPPQNQRAQVTRQIRELEGTRISNTSQRFRFRSLQQRFVSLKQKWNRVQREIEQGTYTPHKQKAKKRMEDRQKQEEQQAAQAQQDQEEDGSDSEGQKDFVELDPDMSRVDLKSLEQELEEMDREGEFEKYVATDRVKRPSEDELDAQSDSGSKLKQQDKQERQESHRPGDDNVFSGQETTRKEKLRSLQDKLGISKGGDGSKKSSSEKGGSGDGSGGRSKSFEDASREPTQRLSDEELEKRQNNRPNREPERRRRERSRRSSRSRSSSSGDKGDDGSESKSRGRSNRVIQRSSDDDSSESSSDDDDDGRDRRLFNRLVDAKRDAGESVEGMKFDDVRDSIRARRKSLREEHGRDVSFNIVRKGDSVYLQPNLDDD
jgi:hypothetical protein